MFSNINAGHPGVGDRPTVQRASPSLARQAFLMPDAYSSKTSSDHPTSISNPSKFIGKNNFPRPPGVIPIIDKRNRSKQGEHGPRCFSVPICKASVPVDINSTLKERTSRPPSTELRDSSSWDNGGEDVASLRKEIHIAVGQKDPKVSSRLFSNGRLPPKPSRRMHFSIVSDVARFQSTLPSDTSNLPPPLEMSKAHFSISGIESGVSRLNNKVELPELINLREFTGECNDTEVSRYELSCTSFEISPPFDGKGTMEMIQMAGKTLFNRDPPLGIEYLLQQRVLIRDPNQIAEFLTGKDLSRQAIGEYFGKLSDPLATSVAEAFIKRLDLRHVEFDVALRRLLQQLHPDGESQKIEFLLAILTKCYIEQNEEQVAKQFNDPETIGTLAYSIMILHTTFYNRNARKHGEPMSRAEFINNNRGIDGGRDISTSLLEGIYDRVTEKEFRTLPDPIDRLRQVDELFTGQLKPERFVQRQRRFIAWFSGIEVFEFIARKPGIHWSTSQIRCLFIFNDLLVVTKPFRSNRNNTVDELLASGNHRLRSIDRLVNRIGSPGPSTTIDVSAKLPTNNNHSLRLLGAQYSTEVPQSSSFTVKQVIFLENVKVLNFECELYKFGVQLCDANSVLTSISLVSAQARKKFIDLVNAAIWEAEEVKYFSGRSKSAPISPKFNSSSSASATAAAALSVQPTTLF